MIVPAAFLEEDLPQAAKFVNARADPFRRRQRNTVILLAWIIFKPVTNLWVVNTNPVDLFRIESVIKISPRHSARHKVSVSCKDHDPVVGKMTTEEPEQRDDPGFVQMCDERTTPDQIKLLAERNFVEMN